MRSSIVAFVAAACCAQAALAEPIAAGKRYAGKVALEVPQLGLGFELPAGFAGALPAGSDWFHIGRDNEEGRVFVNADRTPRAQLKSMLAQPFAVAGALLLTPRGTVREEGSALVADYAASDGSREYQAQARVVSGASGVSVALVAVAPPGRLEPFVRLATQVAATLRFDVPPAVAASPGGGGWAAALANRRVVKFHHGSGYSEKTEFVLCGDGRFQRSFGATSVSQLGTGVASNRNSGRWSVQGSVLTLAYDDGNRVSVQLEDRGGQLFVDGERWLREPVPCS